MKRNKETGEPIFEDYSADLLEACPNCSNINQGLHCSECGASKIVLSAGKEEDKKTSISIFNNFFK